MPMTMQIRSGCEGGGKGALIQENKSATLSTHNTQTLFAPIPIADKATRYKGGGDTRNNDGSANGMGIGEPGAPAYTLTAADRHAVGCPCYSIDDMKIDYMTNKLMMQGKSINFTRLGLEQVILSRLER